MPWLTAFAVPFTCLPRESAPSAVNAAPPTGFKQGCPSTVSGAATHVPREQEKWEQSGTACCTLTFTALAFGGECSDKAAAVLCPGEPFAQLKFTVLDPKEVAEEVLLLSSGELEDQLGEVSVVGSGGHNCKAQFCRDARNVHGYAIVGQSMVFALCWIEEKLGLFVTAPFDHPYAIGGEES